MDLAELDKLNESQEAGVDVQIKHPATGEPLGIAVRVRPLSVCLR